MTRSVSEMRLPRAAPSSVRSTAISCHPGTRARAAEPRSDVPTVAVMLNVSGGLEFSGKTQVTVRSGPDQFTTVWCCTPAHDPGPGPSVKLSPSMPVPSCGPVVFVHGIPLTPAQVPGSASRLSHCASVFGELCRNTALVALVFQAAVTFPEWLVSKVQGVPETKSPSTTWFVESARSEMPAESTAKLESKLPFAANWPGRSHERFWALQGRVALPLSSPAPSRS